jgi:hypothetical protein
MGEIINILSGFISGEKQWLQINKFGPYQVGNSNQKH